MSDEEIVDWLKANDVQLWHDGAKVRDVKKKLESMDGDKINPERFLRLRREACRFWKIERRPRFSVYVAMNEKRWERLRSVVEARREELRGVGLFVAAAIVSTVCRTSPAQLQGLPKRFHVWD